MRNVAIFASGGGTNAEAVITQLASTDIARVKLVITNNAKAGVIERARNLGVAVETIDRTGQDSAKILELLDQYNIEIILLLGYLRLMPTEVIDEFEGHSLNQHPALLPKYGGKGMYGHSVHEAVSQNQEPISGFSLHRVSSVYDDGEVLYQKTVDLPENATPEQVESLVRKLENDNIGSAVQSIIEQNKI